jgi:hypothetical protein
MAPPALSGSGEDRRTRNSGFWEIQACEDSKKIQEGSWGKTLGG